MENTKYHNYRQLKEIMRMKELLKVTIGSGICMFSVFFTVYAQTTTEEIAIDTYYPSPYGSYNELRSNRVAVGPDAVMPASDGVLSWTNNSANGGGTLSADQGASIELRGSGSTPYIDFSNDLVSDYDGRVSLYNDTTVRIYTRQKVEARNTTNSNFHGDLKVKCIRYHWSSSSGTICQEDLIIIPP